jgi:hypothetical protein
VEFRADGTYTELQIGRGDAQSPGPTGHWDTSGRLTRAATDSAATGSAAGRIASVAADRLEIAWG